MSWQDVRAEKKVCHYYQSSKLYIKRMRFKSEKCVRAYEEKCITCRVFFVKNGKFDLIPNDFNHQLRGFYRLFFFFQWGMLHRCHLGQAKIGQQLKEECVFVGLREKSIFLVRNAFFKSLPVLNAISASNFRKEPVCESRSVKDVKARPFQCHLFRQELRRKFKFYRVKFCSQIYLFCFLCLWEKLRQWSLKGAWH